MSILLPKYLTAHNHAETIAVSRQIQDAEGSVVNLDANRLCFVDPFALTLLGASLHELYQWDQRVRVWGLDPGIGGYLRRMDLFEDVEFVDCAPPAGTRHDRRISLVELTRIDNSGGVAEGARRMAQALVGSTGASHTPQGDTDMNAASPADHLLHLVQYVLSELLESAVTHAQRHGFRGKARVWVAAQYYPTSDRVRLAVTDTGCGFLATLRGHPDLGDETHFSAILTGLRPRVSCNRDLGISTSTVNQGVGLTTVVRIAGAARGKALIVSGNAFHSVSGSTGRLPDVAFWQGVAIALEMQRERLQAIRIGNMLPRIAAAAKIPLRFE